MLVGKKTYLLCIIQIITGAVCVAGFIWPEMAALIPALGLEQLTQQEALVSLLTGLWGLFEGAKGITVRQAIGGSK